MPTWAFLPIFGLLQAIYLCIFPFLQQHIRSFDTAWSIGLSMVLKDSQDIQEHGLKTERRSYTSLTENQLDDKGAMKNEHANWF